MGCINRKNNNAIKTARKIYIDLLSEEEPIIQQEKFCGNEIKTTNYSM